MHTTFTGTLTNWTLFGANRKYGTIQNVPYSQARQFIMAVGYNGQTGKGQQRAIVRAHVKKLKAEMRARTFTPTPISAALDKRNSDNLKLDDKGGFALLVDSDDPLLHTDGGHRFEALKEIIADLEKKIANPKTEPAEREWCRQRLAEANDLPFTVTVYFDGNPARDFINLQAGKTVDRSHMLSLSLQSNMNLDPDCRLAMEVAKSLHKMEGSPFQNCIKFDSKGKNPLPISTLCSRSSSDLGTSLVGLARVGAGKGAAFLAKAVTAAYKALRVSDDEDRNAGSVGILGFGKALTPTANDGTKGSSTMLSGVGMCLAFRLIQQGREEASPEDLAPLVDAAKETLNGPVVGSFSGSTKRTLLGAFAKEFFSDVDCKKRHGVPVELLNTLSRATFDVVALPKRQKPPKPPKLPKPAKAPKTKLPDVSGPVTVTTAPAFIRVPAPAPAPLATEVPADESVAPPGSVEAANAEVDQALGAAKSASCGPRESRLIASALAAPFAVEPIPKPCEQEGVDADTCLLTRPDVDA